MSHSSDTIYALSSGALPAGVAVIRISGSKSFEVSLKLTGRASPIARTAGLRQLIDQQGKVIDEALVLHFPAPHSFTGEDCVELQVHGSKAVIATVFAILSEIPELRPAEAGEFSRRAFENGKMDLVEVEGLADLLKAETEMQRRLAVEQSSGSLSHLYDGWAKELTRCRALIEAELDFADEEDVPDSVSDAVWAKVRSLKHVLSTHLASGSGSEIIRDGFKVVLVGAPNVGKSSLMNVLSGRDVAIVTEMAGTTRDVLTVDLDIGGYLVSLSDTAGVRDTVDVVEQEGVRRARSAAKSADLVLFLSDTDSFPEQLGEDANTLRVLTKADVQQHPYDDKVDLRISSATGEGLKELKQLISERIQQQVGATGSLMPARDRHKKRLVETLNYVTEALATEGTELAVRSEYLRLAATSLGRITGRVDVEDLLGVIFSEFCIGK